MSMDFDLSKLSDREILILMAQSQKQLTNEMRELKASLVQKADVADIDALKNKVSTLEKVQWIAAGVVSAGIWFIEKLVLK